MQLLDLNIPHIDHVIERHVLDLRESGATCLPDDKQSLIALYDRLQFHRAQRMRRDLYITATKEKLEELVLRYLDEESEFGEREAVA